MAAKKWVGPSNSEQFLQKRSSAPQISALMAQGVSHIRRESLSEEVDQGLFKDGSGFPNSKNNLTRNSYVTSSVGLKKYAQIVSGGGNFRGGTGDSVKQSPEVYSPLWLSSNLSLPRDRATINAWCRSFYALNPFVHNAINLHSTYPISKLNIKCPNKDIEKFFNDMIEETDLMNICVQIAQEYWLLGESFVYSELDQSKGKWSRLVIQNPDYMIIKRTVVANEPIIMMRPDENLKTIIFSNKSSDVEQRKQLNQHIIDSVKRGENIVLDNFHVSHLARKISPYEIRGTGLPVCIFRNLMLFDRLRESKFAQADNMINPLTLVKVGTDGVDGLHPTFADLESWRDIFECHDEETEVLTENGFKKFDQVMTYQEVTDLVTGNKSITNVKTNPNVKIACFNSTNNQLEYLTPLGVSLYNYFGEMYHFSNEKIDIKVTPNHKMWVSEKEDNKKSVWGNFKKIQAQDLQLNDNKHFRFLSVKNNKLIHNTFNTKQIKEKHQILNIKQYNGKVWCFEVPTGLFITRRNGKITIQGNSSQYDKDFKIFTHAGVTVERVGYGQGIYDISGDITQLIKEIYVGLQVPPVLMDGGADTTYANGGVALDVLRQRYMQFRNMMSSWLKIKIFAPISKIQGFYDYSGGEKQLIVPDIDWNHMSLFDAGDYINTLVTLTQGDGNQKRASLHTLYRSMGLEAEDENRKIRKEAIQNAIAKKEQIALESMDLTALRALDEEDEIPQPQTPINATPGMEPPVPGQTVPGGIPGLDLGPPPGSPPMPGSDLMSSAPSAPPSPPSIPPG